MIEADTIQFAPIRNYNYEEYFQKFRHNGKVLSVKEREKFIKVLDESITQYSEGLPMIKEALGICDGKEDEFLHEYRTVLSVYLFVVITYIDCLVISKYFLLADTDCDKRFMRGKMKVILNEGFKNLYGFNKNTRNKTEWRRLIRAVELCPEIIKCQYSDLSEKLEEHSKSSSWWKEERNLETHLDAEELYESRCEEIEESSVMMDITKLFSTLYAIQLFLTNVHTCFHNTIIRVYENQEVAND